jgi:hypothetical protein
MPAAVRVPVSSMQVHARGQLRRQARRRQMMTPAVLCETRVAEEMKETGAGGNPIERSNCLVNRGRFFFTL